MLSQNIPLWHMDYFEKPKAWESENRVEFFFSYGRFTSRKETSIQEVVSEARGGKMLVSHRNASSMGKSCQQKSQQGYLQRGMQLLFPALEAWEVCTNPGASNLGLLPRGRRHQLRGCFLQLEDSPSWRRSPPLRKFANLRRLWMLTKDTRLWCSLPQIM